MNKRLLTVEDVFAIPGRGVIVVPDIPLQMLAPPHPPTVLLKRPDNTTQTVSATFDIPIFDPPLGVQPRPAAYVCLLRGIEKAVVPIGTEIWVADEQSTEAK
jgi:hypothetical protein